MLLRLTDALWNPWLLALFLLTGLYFSLKTGFFQLFGLRVWLRATVGSILRPAKRGTGGISQGQALCTALASTIGTGSIAGVATAIWLGGPGAVFWLWVSAVLGTMTSFVEKTLTVRYRRPDGAGGWQGGPMYYLRDGLHSPGLAKWFALACLGAAFVGGNLVQSNSIASVLQAAFGWEPLAVGIGTALCAGAVLMGGLKRIARVSTVLVPGMALLYLGAGAVVLVLRGSELPRVLGEIVTGALCPRSALGGAAGSIPVSAAVRYGVARGVFTNEAGLGTSALAHAAADVDCPARQGFWGILEVAVATLLVCSVTALVILVSGVYPGGAELGAPATAAAFSRVLGDFGKGVVAVSLLLFAFSSILGWSYYAQQCLVFLAPGRPDWKTPCRLAFLLCILAGSLWDPAGAWLLVDLCNAMMAVPNLLALLFLAPQALEELEQPRLYSGKKQKTR